MGGGDGTTDLGDVRIDVLVEEEEDEGVEEEEVEVEVFLNPL